MFDRFLKKVITYRDRLIEGKTNCIPLPFERTKAFIPGLVRARNVIVTANSGVGKTNFTKFLYIFWPFLWCRENNVSYTGFYFALEESREEFVASAASFFLHHFYKIRIDVDTLLSMNGVFDEEILNALRDLEPLMTEFLEVVDVQDNISNPTGILKHLETFAKENGKIFTKIIKVKNEDNELEEVEVFDRFEATDPEAYWIAVTDHVSLLQQESGLSLHQTITRFSAEYGRKKITKKYGFLFVAVQQQSAASEAKEYNNKGEVIFDKIEPSLSDLADNKFTQRDAHLVWGVFAPDRYGIETYRGWNIAHLEDNYRSIQIIKNRNGRSNIRISTYFDGAVNFFKELPQIKDKFIDGLASDNWYQKFKVNKEFWIK